MSIFDFFRRKPDNEKTLHVVAMISNPARFKSRYRLFREFQKRMRETAHVKFYTVEIAFGNRPFEITSPNNPYDLQVRTTHELWHKENAINLGVRRLFPSNWKYMAWIDGDIAFANPHWALETIHKLQHYPLIQPWGECIDLGPDGNIMQLFRSFCQLEHKRIKQQTHKGQPYPYGHSGYAWACTRVFYENVGGLMDFPILGSADHHMAWAAIGKVSHSVHGKMSEEFKKMCFDWQEKAMKVTHGHVSYVPGRIEHYWHGKKKDRKYRERWEILISNNYNPHTDLIKDEQGLYTLVGNKPKLQEDIREYFRQRNEDSVDEE